jgi:hypothetical protein
VAGALVSQFNVDLASYVLSPPNTVDVTVQARGTQADPAVGTELRPALGHDVPGVALPHAKVTEVQVLQVADQDRGFWKWDAEQVQALKVVGSVALIGVTAWLASRVKAKS